jgi:hypothetical protein
MCSNAGLGSGRLNINSASPQLLHALLYLLHPYSRVCIFASFYIQDVWYAGFAGAKTGENKFSIRAELSTINLYMR